MAYKDKQRQREYQREWIAKRRNDYLADKSCTQCGSAEDLEIDHIDRASKVSHNIWSWSTERRTAELAKCQVLCFKCHKVKTVGEISYPSPCDGLTTTNYFKHKCRCGSCITAASRQRQAWRERRRAKGLPYA